jgi:hypothetical protein
MRAVIASVILLALVAAIIALAGAPRMPRIGGPHLVFGASVLVMIVALIGLFVRDLRRSRD